MVGCWCSTQGSLLYYSFQCTSTSKFMASGKRWHRPQLRSGRRLVKANQDNLLLLSMVVGSDNPDVSQSTYRPSLANLDRGWFKIGNITQLRSVRQEKSRNFWGSCWEKCFVPSGLWKVHVMCRTTMATFASMMAARIRMKLILWETEWRDGNKLGSWQYHWAVDLKLLLILDFPIL